MSEKVESKKPELKEVEPTKVESKEVESGKDSQVEEGPSFFGTIYNMLFSYEFTLFVAVIIILFESYLTRRIVATVAYTNIDYKAYMEQIRSVELGNYQYDTIEGDTGPLVYPAGHYWIFKFLRDLTIDRRTDKTGFGIERISEGQEVFRMLYLATIVLSYLVCLASGSVYPALTALLAGSYRLHSIYVLRLFNDCFTTFLAIITILLLVVAKIMKDVIIDEGKRNDLEEEFYQDDASNFALMISFCVVFVYSAAVSVKMNALLYLPAVMLILCWLNYSGKHFFVRMATLVGVGIGEQFLIGLPFIQQDMHAYFSTAFNFKRKFMHIWSINWQFIDADVFNSDMFATSLLVLHVMTLIIFVEKKWISPIKKANKDKSTIGILVQIIKDKINNRNVIEMPALTLEHLVYVMCTCNYIGCVFARSLHYQFLSWYHWSIPVILSYGLNTKNKTDSTLTKVMKVVLGVMWYLMHELCWNVYMPKWWSSLLLDGLNVVLLIAVFINYECD